MKIISAIICISLLLVLYSSTLLSKITQNKASTDADALQLRHIYDHALLHGQCYEDLRYLATQIGGRVSGSPQAAAAVEWARQTLETIGLDTVYLQPVMVPHWVRGGKEQARIISNHIGHQDVNVCALGGSVGTGKWGISAPVIAINDLKELDKLGKKQVAGKIVFLNHPMNDKHLDTFTAYSECANDRRVGASTAAKMGALAFVLRSLGNAIDEHPHTGVMQYEENVERIPAAAISTRDAEYLSGLLAQDPNLRFYLNMQCQNLPDALSYNVIGEIKGSQMPNEVIVVGGHLDAWDNGQGAHDDGAGVVQSIEVLRIMKQLGLKPKRTLRCVLFMNEENGARGAAKYAEFAKNNTNQKHILAIESDRGGFAPRGFSVDAKDSLMVKARLQQFQQWQPLFEPYQLHWWKPGYSGVDINFLKDQNLTLMGYIPDPQRYFDYHHTPNDTFDKINKRELELGAAAMTSLSYMVSEHGWE